MDSGQRSHILQPQKWVSSFYLKYYCYFSKTRLDTTATATLPLLPFHSFHFGPIVPSLFSPLINQCKIMQRCLKNIILHNGMHWVDTADVLCFSHVHSFSIASIFPFLKNINSIKSRTCKFNHLSLVAWQESCISLLHVEKLRKILWLCNTLSMLF